MAQTSQYAIRMDDELVTAFKAQCERQGYRHPEVARILFRDYAEGRLSIGVVRTNPPSLEEALS